MPTACNTGRTAATKPVPPPLRRARMSDLAAIAACERAAFDLSVREVSPGVEYATQSTVLAAQIRDGQIHVIGAAPQVLGFISFVQHYDHLFVSTIAVLPAYRRRGFGGRMLACAEAAASATGLTTASLFTDGLAAGNVAFFERFGYVETSRMQDVGFSRVFLSKQVGGVARPSIG